MREAILPYAHIRKLIMIYFFQCTRQLRETPSRLQRIRQRIWSNKSCAVHHHRSCSSTNTAQPLSAVRSLQLRATPLPKRGRYTTRLSDIVTVASRPTGTPHWRNVELFWWSVYDEGRSFVFLSAYKWFVLVTMTAVNF